MSNDKVLNLLSLKKTLNLLEGLPISNPMRNRLAKVISNHIVQNNERLFEFLKTSIEMELSSSTFVLIIKPIFDKVIEMFRQNLNNPVYRLCASELFYELGLGAQKKIDATDQMLNTFYDSIGYLSFSKRIDVSKNREKLDELFLLRILKNIKDVDINLYVEKLVSTFTDKLKLKLNLADFAARTSNPVALTTILYKHGIKISKEVRRVLNSRKEDIIKEICPQRFRIFLEDLVDKAYNEDGSKAEWADIRLLGVGNYSKVYSVGDKVIKFGESLRTHKIKANSSYFIQPLLRFDDDIHSPDDPLGDISRVEIQEKVETMEDGNIEELYQLFKGLLEEGMIWTDVRWCNVGRIPKGKTNVTKIKNHTHTGQVEISEPFYSNLGFDAPKVNNNGNSLVIIDLDYIFGKAHDVIAPAIDGNYYFDFCKRYEIEQKTFGDVSGSKRF